MQLKVDFDAPYDEADPWGYASSWYEERRRQLTLACLPRRRFGSALEIGCASGLFTRCLAERARAVLAVDVSKKAVEWATKEVQGLSGVRVEHRDVTRAWPPGRFDLIVMADVGYYLAQGQLDACVQVIESSLDDPDGVLVAAHWRHPFDGARQSQAAVHAALDRCAGLHRLGAYEDDDLRIDVWSRDGRSVAAAEGLV